MRVSAYELNTYSSHVIVQFENEEVGALNKRLKDLNPDMLRKVIGNALSTEVTSVSLAYGALMYRDKVLDMTYMRIELDDGSMMIFEIYNESAFILTNMNVLESVTKVQRVLKCLDPSLRLRTKFNILVHHT